MAFAHWLRQNSEHYLLVDAQRRMADKYGRAGPPRPKGVREKFWLQVFAPVYRRLPWGLRHFTIRAMPGSHRQNWAHPPLRGTPAVSADGRVTTPPQTLTETRGE
ncbi:MAG: hypothetical protein AB1673_06935 [Actinomycetota bacterium]